jgi:hypothetical protein
LLLFGVGLLLELHYLSLYWDIVKAHLNEVEAELKNHLSKEMEMRKSAEKVWR